MRIGKADLVERVLAAEQAYADERDRWLKINDALFAWMRMVDWLIAAEATRPAESNRYRFLPNRTAR
jgi:hypothetical protein